MDLINHRVPELAKCSNRTERINVEVEGDIQQIISIDRAARNKS